MYSLDHIYSTTTRPYLRNKGGGYVQVSRQLACALSAVADTSDLFDSKLNGWVPVATALHRVAHIICLCAYFKMVWVYALRVVTFMPDYVVFWYGSYMQLIRKARCADKFTVPPACAKYTISAKGCGSKPQPAVYNGTFFNLVPEAFRGRASNCVHHKRDNTYVLQY